MAKIVKQLKLQDGNTKAWGKDAQIHIVIIERKEDPYTHFYHINFLYGNGKLLRVFPA